MKFKTFNFTSVSSTNDVAINLIQKEKKLQFINEGKWIENIEIKFFHGHTTAQMIPIIQFQNRNSCIDQLGNKPW